MCHFLFQTGSELFLPVLFRGDSAWHLATGPYIRAVYPRYTSLVMSPIIAYCHPGSFVSKRINQWCSRGTFCVKSLRKFTFPFTKIRCHNSAKADDNWWRHGNLIHSAFRTNHIVPPQPRTMRIRTQCRTGLYTHPRQKICCSLKYIYFICN